MASFVSRRSNAIGGFRLPLLGWVLVFREVWLRVVPSAVCCRTGLSWSFLLVGIHPSRISIPSSLLMLSGWSLMWIASLTLLVYQYESQSIYFTSLQSGWWPVLLACSERAEVLGKLDSIEASSSLLITCHHAKNKAYFCQKSFHNCRKIVKTESTIYHTLCYRNCKV